jgi:hypothetical protein
MDDQGNATLTPHQDSPWSLSSLSKPSTPQRDLDRLKNIGKIGDLFKGFKL